MSETDTPGTARPAKGGRTPREPKNLPGPLAREVTEAVRRLMGRQGVSGMELATRIGISQNYIAKTLWHEASFTFNDVENIATALGIAAADLVPGKGTPAADPGAGDPAAVTTVIGPDAAGDEGTHPMPVRVDELFENLPRVLSVPDLTRILGETGPPCTGGYGRERSPRSSSTRPGSSTVTK